MKYRLTAATHEALAAAHAAILADGHFETILAPQPHAEVIAPEVIDPETGDEVSPATFGPVTWWLDVIATGLPPLPDGVTVVEGVSSFAPPGGAAPEPESAGFAPLSRRQMLLWLLKAGITEEMIQKHIAAMPDEVLSEATRIEFENNDRIHRDHPLLTALGAAFGITPAAIDAAWPEALEL